MAAPTIFFPEAIDQLAEDISDIAEAKGFWDEDAPPLSMIPIKLVLVHDEISEALQVHRKHYDDGPEDPHTGMTPMQEEDFTEEIADAVIRLLDTCGYYSLDIGASVIEKIEKNKARPRKHGKRY